MNVAGKLQFGKKLTDWRGVDSLSALSIGDALPHGDMLEYSIDQTRRLITTWVRGTGITCEQFQQLWGQMYRDARYDSSFDHLVLIDPDAGGPIQENIPQVCSMLEIVARADAARKKWAVVVPSLGKRLLLEFLFTAVDFGRVRLRVFATEAEAVAWLETRPATVGAPVI